MSHPSCMILLFLYNNRSIYTSCYISPPSSVILHVRRKTSPRPRFNLKYLSRQVTFILGTWLNYDFYVDLRHYFSSSRHVNTDPCMQLINKLIGKTKIIRRHVDTNARMHACVHVLAIKRKKKTNTWGRWRLSTIDLPWIRFFQLMFFEWRFFN